MVNVARVARAGHCRRCTSAGLVRRELSGKRVRDGDAFARLGAAASTNADAESCIESLEFAQLLLAVLIRVLNRDSIFMLRAAARAERIRYVR